MAKQAKPTIATRVTVNTTVQTPFGPLYLRFPLFRFVLNLLGGK